MHLDSETTFAGFIVRCFLLSDVLQELRTYYYHRQHLIEQIAKYTHKMQKSLRLMSVSLDVAIRDITGKSGLAIIDAILSGNRDPHYLAPLVDIRMKKSKEEIADSLQGWWRDELLIELSASLDFYRLYEKALQECDKVIERSSLEFAPDSTLLESVTEKPNRSKKKVSENAPNKIKYC